jgi:predicted small lipoprotein YifL
MKKLIGILITIVFVFSLVGCGKSADAPKKDPAPTHQTAKKSDQLSDKEKAIAVAKEYMADIYTEDYRDPSSFTKGNELLDESIASKGASERLKDQNKFVKEKQYFTLDSQITASLVRISGNEYTVSLEAKGTATWEEQGKQKQQHATLGGTIVVKKQNDGRFLITSTHLGVKN